MGSSSELGAAIESIVLIPSRRHPRAHSHPEHSGMRRISARAGVSPALCDDAPAAASRVRIHRERPIRREMQIALDGKAEPAADRGELREVHVAELGTPEAQIAEPQDAIGITRVEFGEEPRGTSIGREEFDDPARLNFLANDTGRNQDEHETTTRFTVRAAQGEGAPRLSPFTVCDRLLGEP